jgi:hypothetical protein
MYWGQTTVTDEIIEIKVDFEANFGLKQPILIMSFLQACVNWIKKMLRSVIQQS